jgi:hypothetical protein
MSGDGMHSAYQWKKTDQHATHQSDIFLKVCFVLSKELLIQKRLFPVLIAKFQIFELLLGKFNANFLNVRLMCVTH